MTRVGAHPDTAIRRALWWAATLTLIAVLIAAGIIMAATARPAL